MPRLAAPDSWPLRTRLGPLPVKPGSVRLVWFCLAVIALLPILSALGTWKDWTDFWGAGHTVGTPSLMDWRLHEAWQTQQGFNPSPWRYPPAYALLFWPVSFLPVGVGFAINTVVMLALIGVSGLLVARLFGLATAFGVSLAFAWTPALMAVDMGQNMPLAVVLALWAIDALRRDRELEAGLAVGLLMYKPTLGLPLLGFLLLRRCWRAFEVAGVVCGVGYVLSVAAAAGDWLWPIAWWRGLESMAGLDLAVNSTKAVSVPTFLDLAPQTAGALALLAGALVVVVSLRGLVRAPMVEAASAACMIGLVAGPRVYSYETGMLLPILAWAAAGGLSEPWRTRLLLVAPIVGLFWLLSPFTQLNSVTVVVFVAVLSWWRRWPPVARAPRSLPA